MSPVFSKRRRPLSFSLARLASAAAICAAITGNHAQAQSLWTAGSSTDFNWDSALNWSAGIPTSATDVTFASPIPNPGALGTPGTVTLGAADTAKSLLFLDNYILTGGSLNLATGNVNIAGGFNPAISSTLTGSAGLNVTGTGTLSLNGVNTFTGTVAASGASVLVSADSALGDAGNGVSLDTGGALIVGGTFTSARAVTMGTGGGTINVGAAQALTLSSALGATANQLAKAGLGTLTLTAASTRTGVTAVNEGVLRLENVAAAGSGNITVDTGATLLSAHNAATQNFAANVILNGGTFSHNPGANQQLNFAAGKSISIGLAGGTVDVSPGAGSASKILLGGGGISSATGSVMIKTGAGVLQLSGANAGFLGTADVRAGTLEFQNIDTLGTGVKDISVSGTGDFTSSGIAVRHNFTLSNGGTISANSNANADFQGTITIPNGTTGNAALRFFQGTTTANSFKISGSLAGGGDFAVSAPAAATLTLSGNNTGFAGRVLVNANAIVSPTSLASYPTNGITLNGGTLRNAVLNTTSPINAGVPGLTASYYSFGNNPGIASNQFATDLLLGEARVVSRVDSEINIPNNGGGTYPVIGMPGFSFNTNHGVMWKGLLNITQGGSYQFSGINDDNAVLYIDGVQIGTLGVTGNTNTNIGTAINLSAGQHSIVYRFTQGGGGGYSVLNYNGPDTTSANRVVGSIANTVTTGSFAPTDVGAVTVLANSTLDVVTDTNVPSLTLSGGTLTVTSPTISTVRVVGPTTITANSTLAPSSAALFLDGDIAGTGNLSVNGPYATTISGNNSYTGTTSVGGGQLNLASTVGNAIPGNLTVNAAGSVISNVQLLRDNQIADSATLTVTAGTLAMGAQNDTVASLVLNGGTISASTGKLTVGAANLQSGLLGAGLAGNVNVVKSGTGTVTLAAASTYTGVTNVNGGVLKAIAANTLGAGGAGNETVVAAGSQLQLASANNSQENVTIGGNGVAAVNGGSAVADDGAIRNVAGSSTINNLTIASNAIVHVDGGELIINGALNTTSGTLTKSGSGSLTFATPQSSIPNVTLTGGALGFSGPQNFGAVTVPAGFAYRFNTDPGAAATGINVGATSAIIAGYALDQALVSRLAAASIGSVVLTADSANALNLTGANVGLGASGLVTYSGTLTPNAAGYRFSSIAGQGSNVGLNELKVTSGLTGANALSVTGGTVFLTGENSFSGAVSLTGGTTRILNNSALGSGGVTLNGGTLQLLSTTGNAGALFGQFGNIVGDSRTLTIGPAGGAIDVPARIGGDSGFALTGGSGFSPLSGSGTLTKQGMGQLFLLNPSDFSGNLVIAANGDRVDVRSSGSLANVASITVNSRGILLVDNQNALGSRQFVSVNNNDRINNAAPITLNGGGVLYRARGATSQNTETFGSISLGVGQNAIDADSNSSGTVGGVLTFGAFSRVTGSTLRLGGNAGTFGAGTANTPGGNNTQVLFTGMAASPLLPYATIYGTDLVQYDAAVGAKIAAYTDRTNAAAITPASGQNINLTSAATTTMTAGPNSMLGLRFGGGNNAQVLAFDATTPGTLFIEGGAIVADANAQNRDIGTTALRGTLTVGPASGATSAQELFLHNRSGTLRIFSTIVENNGQQLTVVKDEDGAVQLDAPNNTYTGGTYVLRGTLQANAAGSLGTGNVTVSNARVQLQAAGAAAAGTTITAMNNGEINLNSAVDWATNGSRYVVQSGSVILGTSNNTTANLGLNSLTRVSGTPANGGEIQIGANSIVGHFTFANSALNGTGINTIKNLGTNADLFYGLSLDANAGAAQSVTLGAGTPWKGISTDRNSRRWNQGTIYANSDFWLQGMIRDNSAVALTLGSVNATGTLAFVNQAGKPINAYVAGQVVLDEDTPTSMPNDLTFVLTPGSIFQPNRPAGLGLVGDSRAKVLVQAGGILDPGNFVPVGAAANQPFGMAYPAISPLNGSVTVEKGGRFVINDASGIGSAPAGSYQLKEGSILDLGNAAAFLGSGNSLFNTSATNTGFANIGQFVYEPGTVVRVQADGIYKLSQFVTAEPNGERVTFEIFGGNRNLTNQVNPFVAQAVGTSVFAPETIRLANGGMVTNDDNDRSLNEGRGKLVLGNGAIFAGTAQTHMQIQEGLEIEAGATITIGSATQLNGLSKLGSVLLTGPNSNTAGAGAKFNVISGAQLSLNTINVIPDTMGIHLEAAPAVQYQATGANVLIPGTGSTLLLNYNTNQTEIFGPLTGNGAIILNNTNTSNPALTSTTLGAGWGATSDFEFAGSFKSYNAQNPGLFKVGPTKMSLTGVSDSTGDFGVFQGELSFSGAGQIASGVTGTVRVGRGAILSIDDSTGALASPRLGNKSVNGQGGNLVIKGGTTAVTETVFQLNSGSTVGDMSFVNVESGTADTNLLITTIERFENTGGRQSTWVFRGPGMAGLPGTYAAGVYTPNPSNPTTGLIRATNPNFFTNAGYGQTTGNMQGYIGTPLMPVRGDLLGDVNPNGKGTGFVTQESSTTGFRLLADSEYQNFFHWGTANNNAVNVKLSSAVTGIGGDTRLSTLTLANNASISMGATLPLNQTPSRLVINAGGILVQPGANATINAPYLQSGGSGALSFHAQGDLTVNAITFADTSLVKNGPGTLNFGAGTMGIWRGTFTINDGTVNLGADNTFFATRNQNGFSGPSLHLNGGTLNLNGNSQMINALNSSNILPGFGGVLSSSSVASLVVQGGGAFAGSIQGPISIDKVGNNTLLLTGANPYSGSTVVRGGTLQLRDSGRLTGTSNVELVNANLQLDNGYLSNIQNRLPAGINIVSKGGSFTLNGAAGQVAKESLGTLTLNLGLTTINNSAGGNGANEITYANIARAANSGTMINFGQNYGFLGTPGDSTTGIRNIINNINNQPVALTNGIIGGWAIGNGDHFVTYSSTAGVGLLSNTADGFATYGGGDLSTASAASGAVNYNDGTSRTIPAGAIVNSIRNAPGATQTMTLSGGLSIASGGLLTNANVGITYNGGTMTSGSDALYVWVNQNTTTINSAITGGIDLVKGGGATLTLGGANSFGGTTFVNSGTLNMGVTGANGGTTVAVPGDLMINGGATATVTVARSIKESANVTITGSGRLNLRDAAATVETLASINFRDGGGANGTMNVDRAASRPDSTLNLTAATAISAVNTNPSTGVPFFGAFLGKLGFTGAGAQTINVSSPLTDHGLGAIGLRIDAQIAQTPAAGLVKTGNGLLALNPTNSGAVNFTGVTTGYNGNLISLVNVMDVQQGILRFDNVNAAGTNTANFTIQSGAGLLYRNVVGNGSVRLNAGSFLGAVEGNATIGTATTTVANQTVLNVAGDAKVYVADYFVQGTNAITVAVNGRLTGVGNIDLVAPQITGAAGVLRLGNPILTGTGANDYSGTIKVNTNTILENQVALVAPAIRQTGSALAGATIELNGGRLRLRDDLSDSADATGQTITYGNNVTLLADSFLDANRQNGSTAITANTIVLGTLTVPSGTKTLTVDSGNSYGVTFNQLAGSGVLMKGGNSVLTITDYAPGFSGGVGIQGSQGLGTQYAQNLVLVPTVNTMGTFISNGGYSLPAGKTLDVTGTLKVGNNAGTIGNGYKGVTSGENVGSFHAQAGTTVTAGILENDGLIGSYNNDQTISAPSIRGTGNFTTVGQTLTLDGNLVNGATASKLKFTGDSIVNLTGATHTASNIEVQSGTLRIAPTSGTATLQGNINVMAVPASAVATGANAAQAVAGIAGTLQFDAPTVAHSGNITNSGTVRVASGITFVTGTIAGTPLTYVPGLLEGRVGGTNSLATGDIRPGNPGTFGIKLEPRMAQTNLLTNNPITGWSSNEMWVYTGEFFDADGRFTFAEAIDDLSLVSIDGVNRIVNTGNGTNQPAGSGPWNTITTTSSSAGQQGTTNLVAGANSATPALDLGMGPKNDGWHTFEVRVLNSAGGGGAGFFANFGLGLNADGTTAYDAPVYTRPIDPGDGSLFRTQVGGAGKIQIDSGSRLNVGGFNTISEVKLVTGAGTSPTLSVTTSDSSADKLAVEGVLTNASVNVAAGKTLTVGSLVVDDGGALTLNTEDSGTLAVTGNYTIPAAAKVFVEKGTLRLGGNGGAVGTDIQVYQDGTLDLRGSLTGNVTLSGATLIGSGSVNGFVLVGSSTVAPGVTTPAILTVDSLGADVASTFAFDLGGTVAGVTYDQLKITGPDFDLGSAQLTLANAGGLVADSVLTIVMNAGGDVNFGMFSGLPSGSNINLGGGMSAQISYYDNPLTPQFEIAGANQTNVSLLVVPEPASAALLLGGLASMLGLRRRRRA